jgi:hypothetical protein
VKYTGPQQTPSTVPGVDFITRRTSHPNRTLRPTSTTVFIPTGIDQRTNECFLIAGSQDEFNAIHGKLCSDQTGKFPIPSAAGNTHIMICYAYDLNVILTTPYRSKNKTDMVKAFETIYNCLTAAGTAPRLHILENECPRHSFMAAKANTTSSRHTITAATQLNASSARSKIISLPH